MKKTIGIIGNIIGGVITFLAFWLAFSIRWVLRTWVNLSMEELVYTLTALEGTAGGMVSQYIVNSVIPAALIMIILGAVAAGFYRKRGSCKWIQTGTTLLAMVLLVSFAFAFWTDLDVARYLKNRSEDAVFVDQHYVNPVEVEIEFPAEKRNLIYIYLESMETTYADVANGGGFGYNCIPELTRLAQENEDFSGQQTSLNGGHALTGSTWTMGALFAQTSGIPLQLSGNINDMETQDSFFQGMVNLGDVLKEQGYNQAFMIGSQGAFGGRELFFQEHGSYDVLDYEYAIDEALIPNSYMVFWGYEDGKLFDFAKDEIVKLAGQDGPFNFTMLTVDTHFEDGYVCEQCGNAFGDNQYANVMACSSSKVAQFIAWIQEQEFYENTTIVLSGDHLTMDSDFCNDVADDYDRKTYTCFINPGCENEQPELERIFTTMDMFPTTLAALGARIDGERLGLGTNLFSSTPTLAETYGVSYVDGEVAKQSTLLAEMGTIDTTTDAYLKRTGQYPTAIVGAALIDGTDKLEVRVEAIANLDNLSHVELDLWPLSDEATKSTVQLDFTGDVYVTYLSQSKYQGQLMCSEVYVVDKDGRRYQVGELTKDWELYTNSMPAYLSVLKQKGYTVFLAARDEAAAALKPLVKQKFQNLGLQKDLKNRSSYYAVIDGGQVISEQVSQERIAENGVLSDGKTKYSIMSSGFDAGAACSIRIQGSEKAINGRGINIVVYDSKQGVVVDSVCFDTHTGESLIRSGKRIEVSIMQGIMSYKADGSLQQENLIDYLALLKDRESVVVFIAVKDDAGYGLTEEMKAGLKSLGLKTDFADFFRSSYCAIIDGTQVTEKKSMEALEVKGVLDNGTVYAVKSAGFLGGSSSSIKLEGIEFAMNQRGINFVIYDIEANCVVDVVSFDTHDSGQVKRK